MSIKTGRHPLQRRRRRFRPGHSGRHRRRIHRSFDAQYKTIRWVNGDPKLSKTRTCTGRAVLLPRKDCLLTRRSCLTSSWAEVTLTQRQQRDSSYFKRDMQIIPIIISEAWNIKGGGRTSGCSASTTAGATRQHPRLPQRQMDGFAAKEFGSPSIPLQVLCLLVGMEEEGPRRPHSWGRQCRRALHDERATDAVLERLLGAS